MKSILIAIVFWFATPLSAQQDLNALFYPQLDMDDVPYHLATRIHSLDDFFHRFNGKHNGIGRPFDKNSSSFKKVREDDKLWLEFRKKIIGSLFSTKLQSESSEEIKAFCDSAIGLKELNYTSTKIVAYSMFTTYFNCNRIKGQLFLQFCGNEDAGYYWAIDSMYFEDKVNMGKLQEVCPTIDLNKFIPPNSQNNGFLSVQQIIAKKEIIAPYLLRNSPELDIFNAIIQDQKTAFEFSGFQFILHLENKFEITLNNEFEIIEL